MRNSIISIAINIILAYILFGAFKTPGLALAAAGGSVSNAVLNAVSLRSKKLFGRQQWLSVLKMLVCALVMGGFVWLSYSAVSNLVSGFIGNIIVCGVCGILGILVYFFAAYILRIDIIINLFKKGGDE